MPVPNLKLIIPTINEKISPWKTGPDEEFQLFRGPDLFHNHLYPEPGTLPGENIRRENEAVKDRRNR